MCDINNKIELLRQILDIIEEENHLTSSLNKLTNHSRREYGDFCPETIYFDLINLIIKSKHIPRGVHSITAKVDKNNRLIDYDLQCDHSIVAPRKLFVEIIFTV